MPVAVRIERVSLHEGGESLCVVHLSDFHIRSSRKKLDNLERQVFELNPELILMTGDYYDTGRGAKLFREFMINLGRRITVVFITGNHDHWFGTGCLPLLEDIPGCHCVDDAVFHFTSVSGRQYSISSWANRKALLSGNFKKIVLVHNPKHIIENELAEVDLLLAGHLHGGQFIFYRTKAGNFFPGNLLYRYCTDRTEIGGTPLIVSRGLGDTFPFRFNCPKEIVRIDIV